MNELKISANKLNKIINAKKVLVITGAGISKESGIPTFRGEEGLWKKFSPQELASFEGFYKDPALVSEWYQHRRQIIEDVEPNEGHKALVELEEFYSEFTIVTQNVDNLHTQAGSENVIEIHGNIMRNYCIDCGKFFDSQKFNELYSQTEEHIPKCDDCKGLIRPDVVWFGEQLPEREIKQSFQKAQNCDLCFSIGTSSKVRPAADIPMVADQNGVFIVEINTDRTPLTLR
ncbi:MAG: NAD-dependent deacylase, partial [Candidatus Marinimicrobia bacterium]|nr:NAD-dependent deacylase [Candidatus Neomarinimicrobiota bacterium]